MRYKICESDNILELQEIVEGLIKVGYKPQGGISVAINPATEDFPTDVYWYTQAMVKENKLLRV